MRPVRFRYLYIKDCIVSTHTIYNVIFFSKVGTSQRKRCTLKNNIKSHIFIIYIAPCQICFIFASKFVFYRLTLFTIFSSSKGTNQRNSCTFKNNVKSYISFLQCALTNFFIFTSKFVFSLCPQFTMFSSFRGTCQRNSCTL